MTDSTYGLNSTTLGTLSLACYTLCLFGIWMSPLLAGAAAIVGALSVAILDLRD